MATESPDQAWFTTSRLGLFLHWGLYSLPARHEWVMSYEEMPAVKYGRYAEAFDPDLFDADEWMAAAVRAGAGYVVITAKHHDGFCLWDTHQTDYQVTNTPFARDALRELVDAARRHGLRIGIYYSLLDWHHPDFTIDLHHPLRHATDAHLQNQTRAPARYREYLHAQVRELLTGYGTIDYLFFDFSYDDQPPLHGLPGKGAADWGSDQLLTMVRHLQPGILVNDRLGIPGDVTTPEQYQPSTTTGPTLWEACQTTNGSWGYERDNQQHKSADLLLRMLVDGVSKGGNMLLNVGANGRGAIDHDDLGLLDSIGDWMHLHARSVRGAGPCGFQAPPDCRYTATAHRLYLHLFAWPHAAVHLPGLAGRIGYAQLLNDASEIPMSVSDPAQIANGLTPPGQPKGTLTLHLPPQKPDTQIPVIELSLIDPEVPHA